MTEESNDDGDDEEAYQCYACGGDITPEDIYDNPLNFQCPHCGTGMGSEAV